MPGWLWMVSASQPASQGVVGIRNFIFFSISLSLSLSKDYYDQTRLEINILEQVKQKKIIVIERNEKRKMKNGSFAFITTHCSEDEDENRPNRQQF